MKIGLRAGAIVVIGTFASGCATGGYDPGAMQRHLVAAGVAPAVATCVADHMAARFGETRLATRANPSAAELNAERALLRRCDAASPPRP